MELIIKSMSCARRWWQQWPREILQKGLSTAHYNVLGAMGGLALLALALVLFLLPGGDDGGETDGADEIVSLQGQSGIRNPSISISTEADESSENPSASGQTLTSSDAANSESGLNEAFSNSAISESGLNQASGESAIAGSGLYEAPGDSQPSPWQHIEVRPGENLSMIFQRVGLSDQTLFRVLSSSDEAKILNRIYPGYELHFMLGEPGELEQLRVLKNPLEGYLFTRNDSSYVAETIQKDPQLVQSFKVGTISDSLFVAGQREDIPAIHIMEMANIFGGVIDFILDPRAGDQFSILYEEKYLDGEFVETGQILATQYINQGRVYTAIRYEDEDGEYGFFSPDGESMRKAFLRNPLDVFRISSNFNPRRRHPILNTIRAHRGTDYAAPTGTPIRATGDGRVTWVGRNGSFGKLIVVKHSGGFETKYAHLSRYAVSNGARVRQGQVIGYVGMTGGATGPHLHYEFLIHGTHYNPRTVHHRLPKAEAIDPAEMDRFRSQTAGLLQQFSNLNNSLTLAGEPGADTGTFD